MYECALLERWAYVVCYVSCLSFFLHIGTNVRLIKTTVSTKTQVSNSKVKVINWDQSFKKKPGTSCRGLAITPACMDGFLELFNSNVLLGKTMCRY